MSSDSDLSDDVSGDEESTKDISKVVPRLYLGNARCGGDHQDLHDRGITFVLSLDCVYRLYSSDCKYKHIDIRDHSCEDIMSHFDACFDLIEKELATPSNRILIHCRAGVSRSATITIAYLMKKNSWSFQEAFDQVKQRRPQIKPNRGFQQQLKLYEYMNFTCDVSCQEYRNFILRCFIQEVVDQQPWMRPASNSIYFKPLVDYFKKFDWKDSPLDSIEYQCIKCQKHLFNQSNVITKSTPDDEDDDAQDDLSDDCEYLFIEPRQWMVPKILVQKRGKLRCSVCNHFLGKFNWRGYTCNCSNHSLLGDHFVFRVKNKRFKIVKSLFG